jgi:hypothetical protein
VHRHHHGGDHGGAPLRCLCSLPKSDGGTGRPTAMHRHASGGVPW